MLEEQALKERLQQIVANDYRPPTRPELLPLVLAMGTHLGSTDPELRDDLIYGLMARWITQDLFQPDELEQILQVVLNDNHLFLGLGEVDSDTVFMRSFSLLVLALVLDAHRRNPFLPAAELNVIKNKVLRYLAAEQDLRGYVPGKGWAHAVAHAGDVLDELAQCEVFEEPALREMLEVLGEKIRTPKAVYVFEEDERLATAVLAAWRRPEVLDETILAWLATFREEEAEPLPLPQRYHRFVNSKTFLRSLYFRVQGTAVAAPVQQAVAETVAHYHRFRAAEEGTKQ